LGRHSIRAVSVSYRTACANLLDVMTQTESSLRRLGNTAGSNLLADSSQRIAQQVCLMDENVTVSDFCLVAIGCGRISQIVERSGRCSRMEY
jgi:hypothetical protein